MLTVTPRRITRAREEISWLLATLLRMLHGDAASLSIPGTHTGLMNVGVLNGPEASVEFLPLETTSTFHEHVVSARQAIAVPSVSQTQTAQPDTFMQAEEMRACLGAPILAPDDAALGAVFVMSREERIWSQQEVHDLSIGARLAAHIFSGLARADVATAARALTHA